MRSIPPRSNQGGERLPRRRRRDVTVSALPDDLPRTRRSWMSSTRWSTPTGPVVGSRTWVGRGGSRPRGRREFVRESAGHWTARMDACARAFAAHPHDLRIEVRYEELLADTMGGLGELNRWLGVPSGPQRMKAIAEARVPGTVPKTASRRRRSRRVGLPGRVAPGLTTEEQAVAQEIMGRDPLRARVRVTGEALHPADQAGRDPILAMIGAGRGISWHLLVLRAPHPILESLSPGSIGPGILLSRVSNTLASAKRRSRRRPLRLRVLVDPLRGRGRPRRRRRGSRNRTGRWP